MKAGRRELTGGAGAALLACALGAGCPDLTLPDFADWPVDTQGYEIEELPTVFVASFARGNDVYFGRADGEILKADDRDLSQPWVSLGRPFDVGPRLLFVSSAKAVFVSPNERPTHRSDDEGLSWTPSLDVPVWRMDEDDQGNLYAGNYTSDDEHVATVYKSTDGGITWSMVFEQADHDHVHTVRWDDQEKRLYVAYGDDGRTRGQAYSDDRGASFRIIARGPGQGHTDVALTNDYVIWASDDQSGRVLRVARRTGVTETLMGRSQFMWFAVAGMDQVYVGTMTSAKNGGDRAALLASHDQGDTWQKLLETDPSDRPYGQGFIAESRVLSAGGWLYCTAQGKSYRIRRRSEITVSQSAPQGAPASR